MDAIYWALAASAGAGAIGVARLATALTRRHRRRRALEVPASVDDPTRGRPRPWIIMNPSKQEDPQAFKDRLNRKAKELGIDTKDSVVRTTIGLGPEGDSFALTADIKVFIPGVELDRAQALVDRAHQLCPYSKATRGNVPVTVTAVASF